VSGLEIRSALFADEVSARLIEGALAELSERYGGDGDSTPIDGNEFSRPGGDFVIALLDGEPVGCGGWRTLGSDETIAEIKRMYVIPQARGRGIAMAVLRALEESARSAGKKQIWLETGDQQPEAIALYQKAGYERITDFGYYKDYDGVCSFGRMLE
jgi:GNAT superfamily N-acetyltransferase